MEYNLSRSWAGRVTFGGHTQVTANRKAQAYNGSRVRDADPRNQLSFET